MNDGWYAARNGKHSHYSLNDEIVCNNAKAVGPGRDLPPCPKCKYVMTDGWRNVGIHGFRHYMHGGKILCRSKPVRSVRYTNKEKTKKCPICENKARRLNLE